MNTDVDLIAAKTAARGRRAVWLATGLGVGMASPAPGTIGGLWGLPLAWWACSFPQAGALLAIVGVLSLAAVAICQRAATEFGDADDPPAVVLDEIVATPLAFLGVGFASWQIVLGGWLLFRLFDIWKPGPVRVAEKLPGGWGIVADDLAAALLACVTLNAYLWIDGVVRAWGG
jgi:phosphatidylglycerophosphatase A